MTKYLILASTLVLAGCGSTIHIPDINLFSRETVVSSPSRIPSSSRSTTDSAPLVDSIQEDSSNHWWDEQCREEDYRWENGRRIKPDNC